MNTARYQDSSSDEAIAALRDRFPTDRQVDKMLSRKLVRRRAPQTPYAAAVLKDVQDMLERYLQNVVGLDCVVNNVRELTGGISKEQFRFQLQTSGADNPLNGEYVLRLQTPESIVETSRESEATIIRSLQGILPVPDVPWIDCDGTHFGQPALIMNFVEGLVKPKVEDGEDITGPKQGFSQRDRELVGPGFLEAIAAVHKVDCSELVQDIFTPVHAGSAQASLLQINWWRRVWEEDRKEASPLLTMVADWLVKNAPVTDRVSLVHGDLRAGNFIYDPDTGAIRALLDWELAHIGDRHEDLAYTMLDMFGALDENGQFLVNGFWSTEHFINEYERLSGLTVDPVKLTYYRIFHGFRSAVISLGTAQEVASKRLTHQDCLLAWIVPTGVITLHDLIADLERLRS